jgi:3' exoribonuclease, RNase T-like
MEEGVIGAMTHISFDIETLGTAAGSVVLAIGASTTCGRYTFYANLDRFHQQDRGATVSQSTIDWWATQDPRAQEKLLVDVQDPREALRDLTDWLKHVGFETVWGWGANFDIVLIERLYALYDMPHPWKHWAVRCGRTLCALADVQPVRVAGSHHTADEDAKRQGDAIVAAAAKLGVVLI